MLKIDERIRDDGTYENVMLSREGDMLIIHAAGNTKQVPIAALDAVMRRYGRPLDDPSPRPENPLDLGDGVRVWILRHRARYDVLGRDFVVLERPDAEPVAELATTVTAALLHLASVCSP